MTLYIPLDASDVHPNSPPFLVPSPAPEGDLTTVIQAILKAKRIAVVCGAGISVEAGIPDFRSQDGLFQSLKRNNPKEALSSGKDLFDAAVFKSTEKTALFYRMIARLSSLSSQGMPTLFHQLLRTLDDRGQLLRVYTQNIDALEMKAGLSFGVPEFEEKKLRVKLKGKAKVKAKEAGTGAYNARLGRRKGKRPVETVAAPPLPTPPNEVDTPGAGPSTPSRLVTPSFSSPAVAEPYPLNVIPRCIPLHGTLLTLHCQHCTQSFPLDPPTLQPATPSSPPPSPSSSTAESSSSTSLHSLLAHGTPPPCPSCTSLEQTRALVGKRLRGVGKLRPSVVLYGEEHREGEGVGEAVRRDLCGISDAKASTATPDKTDAGSPSRSRVRAGKGPDLLLVVGTSLRVPGTKRIVREFSKAVRPSTSPSTSRLPTPTSPPPVAERSPPPIRTVYLNLEFPLPAREWEGVFDVWVNGDAQAFAKAMTAVIDAEEEKKASKKQREGKAKADGKAKAKGKNVASGKAKGKRKAEVPETPTRPSKKRKVTVEMPPTPASLSRHNGRGKKIRQAEASPHKPRRRVILRLPPPPIPVTPSKPALKRKRSIPEVVITSKPGLFSRRLNLARSLSPLTSLTSSSSSMSSLTPLSSPSSPSSPLSSSSSSAAVNVWRKNVGAGGPKKGRTVDVDSEFSDDEPLAMALARRTAMELWRPVALNHPHVKYTYASRTSRSGDRASSDSEPG